MKIKIYRMPLSRVFPATHPQAGKPTGFRVKLIKGLVATTILPEGFAKIHTIRTNVPMWKQCVEEVNAGTAVLVLYEWSGKPRRSGTKNVFMFGQRRLYKEMMDMKMNNPKYERTFIHAVEEPLGIQELRFIDYSITLPIVEGMDFSYAAAAENELFGCQALARNDGLSWDDFKAWFKDYDLTEPMAIIHFTKYRYT